MAAQTQRTTALSFTDALTVLFVGLKLTNHIGWSWWWVLAPTLVSLVLAVFAAVAAEAAK